MIASVSSLTGIAPGSEAAETSPASASSASSRSDGFARRLHRRRSSTPTRMFSRAVSDPNTSSRWNVRPMPACARRWARILVMSMPPSRTRPADGRLEPGDHVEGGRLARAVRPDEARDRARPRP